jgi:hypothetical protein
MGDTVVLRGLPIDLASDAGHDFIVDATRAGEGLITDKELAEKYDLAPSDWRAIAKDRALGRAVRAEAERRQRDGTSVREAASKHLLKGPGILDNIMENSQSDRSRIEAFRALQQTAAAGGTDRLPETARFIIRIDMSAGGGDVEHFDIPRAPMKIDADGDISSNPMLEGKRDGE